MIQTFSVGGSCNGPLRSSSDTSCRHDLRNVRKSPFAISSMMTSGSPFVTTPNNRTTWWVSNCLKIKNAPHCERFTISLTLFFGHNLLHHGSFVQEVQPRSLISRRFIQSFDGHFRSHPFLYDTLSSTFINLAEVSYTQELIKQKFPPRYLPFIVT